jgi:hypothetical protein
MAAHSDVANALVGLIGAALYPSGTSQPSAVTNPCRVYRGWPAPAALQADLRGGVVNVNVWPDKVVRNVTRYVPDWQQQTVTPPTLGVTFTQTTVTITGTVTPGNNVAIIVGGNGYSYTAQAGDSLTTIAAALATLISANQTATSSGATVTIPGAVHLNARTGGAGTIIQMVAQQIRQFQINMWCQTPTLRDAVGAVIAPILAATPRLIMPDTTTARLQLVNDGDDDDGQQKEQVYRRFITYAVEYATTQLMNATQVVVETTAVSGGLTATPNPIVTVSQ